MLFYDKCHDKDSTKDVWDKLYSIVYKKDFGEIFDFNNIDDKKTSASCKRWYIKINKEKNPELWEKYPHFKIAGDCDFNFNEKKEKMFKEIISEKDYELLEECCRNHHELWNFSFMPITGGMNNAKGCLCCINQVSRELKPFDRLDLFIYELDLFYHEKENRIFNNCTEEGRDALTWYLRQFHDVYDYCKKIYFIEDKDFVNELISFAEKPINKENAVSYMKLAIKYWNYKKDMIKRLGVNL